MSDESGEGCIFGALGIYLTGTYGNHIVRGLSEQLNNMCLRLIIITTVWDCDSEFDM